MSNDDTDRILEAIGTLTQQINNLEYEMAGLRSDVRQMAISNEDAKKKSMSLSDDYTMPWLSLRDFARGAAARRRGKRW